MKITKIEAITCEIITTDTPEHNEYIRFGPDAWWELMGNSYEAIYFDEELERLYQEMKGE